MATTSEEIMGKCTTLLRAGRTSKIENISIDWGVSRTRDSAVDLNGPDAIQQSPAMIKHLYPHSRFLIYAILDSKDPPKKVKVRGTVDGGRDVELVVKVESVKFGKDRKSPPFIHTLAARRLIKDLEDDSAKGKLAEEVWKKEVVRLGERYQLASSQTSFVAVYSGKTPSPKPSSKASKSKGVTQSAPTSPAILRTLWTYAASPFALYGSNKVELMTQPNRSVPGGWPDGSEVSARQTNVSRDQNEESGYVSSCCSRSTMSSLVDRSSFDSKRDQPRPRGRRARSEPRPETPPQDPTQRDRSPSPQLEPNYEATRRRSTQQVQQPPSEQPATAPRRISSDVLKLVQSMSYEGSFTLVGPLADIVGQETLEKARGLHTDEVLCATAISIAYLEKNLPGQPELLAALVDKGMEFVRSHSSSKDFRRVLARARELVN